MHVLEVTILGAMTNETGFSVERSDYFREAKFKPCLTYVYSKLSNLYCQEDSDLCKNQQWQFG